jgi:hypothetical protein
MPVTLGDEERRLRISLRRGEHFFGNGARGIYERFGRRGDPLYEFAEILNWIIALDTQLIPAAITTRFVQSARHGGFGWRRYGPRRGHTVADLIDLSRYSSVAPGQYPLRPSTFTVGEIPLHMRAPKSIWVSWLREQGLPVPRELAAGMVLLSADGAAEPVQSAPGTKLKPASRRRPARLRGAQALVALFPNGVPAKSLKQITNEVNKYLTNNKDPPVSEDTVSRAIEELLPPQETQI